MKVAHLHFNDEAAREGIRAWLAALERRGLITPEALAQARAWLDEKDSARIDWPGQSSITEEPDPQPLNQRSDP